MQKPIDDFQKDVKLVNKENDYFNSKKMYAF